MPQPNVRRSLAWRLALVLAAVLVLAGCRSSAKPLQAVDAASPAAPPGANPPSTFTPTSAPTVTPTPIPLPTATPTPLAVTAAGSLPIGQTVFSTARDGEAGQDLWRLPAGQRQLSQLTIGLADAGWDCAGEPPACAFVGAQGEVMAAAPVSGSLAVLDQLALLPPTSAGITATRAVSASAPMTASVLSLSGDGALLALVTPAEVRLYDLAARQPLASIAVTGTLQVAWSPDSSRLSLIYRPDGGTALALWNRADGKLRVLARMNEIANVAWAPDGKKLAFDARADAATPTSQGGQSDVYVLYLDSGEVRNLTEIFLRNAGVAVNQQVAAWRPAWEADSKALRYVRGIPTDPETHQVFRHPLSSRSASPLWPVSEEGVLGLSEASGGKLAARAVEREGFLFVQVREGDADWRDAAPAGFRGLRAMTWMPGDATPGSGEGGLPARSALLLAADQGLLVLDIITGAILSVASPCPECSITRVEWLP